MTLAIHTRAKEGMQDFAAASLQRRAKLLASYARRAISTQQSALWLPTAES